MSYSDPSFVFLRRTDAAAMLTFFGFDWISKATRRAYYSDDESRCCREALSDQEIRNESHALVYLTGTGTSSTEPVLLTTAPQSPLKFPFHPHPRALWRHSSHRLSVIGADSQWFRVQKCFERALLSQQLLAVTHPSQHFGDHVRTGSE